MKWIQISDLHYNTKGDGNYTMKAREKLPIYISEQNIAADHLFVTGDYRHAWKQRNQPEDEVVSNAVEYILKVATAGNIPFSNIHVIPGNHDLSRFDKEEDLRKLQTICEKYSIAEDPGMFSEEELEFLNAPFSFFLHVCNKLKEKCEEKKTPIRIPWLGNKTMPSVTIEKYSDFLLLSLNSCLFCHTDDSRGKLLVDTCAIWRKIEELQERKLPLIILAHHGIGLLDSKNQMQLLDALDSYQGPVIYLCGDAHDYRSVEMNNILIITVGCLLQDKSVTTMISSGIIDKNRICDIRGYNCIRGRWGNFSQYNDEVADRLVKHERRLDNIEGAHDSDQLDIENIDLNGNISITDSVIERSTYDDAIKTPYGLLITDITGVLFDSREDGREEFSQAIVETFSSLAKRHISICFTTGRGRTGARQLLLNLAQKIIAYDETITWEDLSRDWACITHNGAYLLTTPDKSKSGFLANTEKLLSQLHEMRYVKLEEIENSYKSIIYSACNSYNLQVSRNKRINKDHIKWSISLEPVSVRFSLENCPESLCNTIFAATENDICKQVFRQPDSRHSWFATRGKYEDKDMFEYSMANKEAAINEYIRCFRAIENRNIMRLTNGSQHAENGEAVSSDIAVFCVGDLSKGNDCNWHPVFDDAKKILYGTEATNYLLNKLYFYPSFSLKRVASAEKYKKEFAESISGAKKRSDRIFNYYSSRLAWIDFLYEDSFSANNTSLIFDVKSGAVSFSDYEWTRIENILHTDIGNIHSYAELQVSYFAKLLSQKANQDETQKSKPNLMYFLHTDTHVLFRGLLYYYYLYQSNISKGDTDSISVENWIKIYQDWLHHAHQFAVDFADALNRFDENKELPIGYLARKLMIGGLDNIRNILLLLDTFYLRQAIHAEKKEASDFLLSLGDQEGASFLICKKVSALLTKCLSSMYSVLFESQIDSSFPSTVISWLNDLVELLSERTHDYDYLEGNASNLRLLFPANKDGGDKPDLFFTECFPRWRESDCFIESVAAIELYLLKVPDSTEKFVFWGVPYGSLEHPVLANYLCKKHGCEATEYPYYVILHGKYEERHNADFHLLPICNSISSEEALNVLIDDTVTTGKTIDLCAKTMCLNNVPLDSVIVTRYAGLNRISHYLTHLVETEPSEEKTLQASAPDVSKFFNLISGLVSEAPYTKLYEYGSNEKKPYEDVRGVFDKAKQRMKQYLETNY